MLVTWEPTASPLRVPWQPNNPHVLTVGSYLLDFCLLFRCWHAFKVTYLGNLLGVEGFSMSYRFLLKVQAPCSNLELTLEAGSTYADYNNRMINPF